MRKICSYLCGAILVLSISSCSVTYHKVTSNPIGEKEGIAKGSDWAGGWDYSYSTAAENGNIQTIGTSKIRVTNYVVVNLYKTRVTGE